MTPRYKPPCACAVPNGGDGAAFMRAHCGDFCAQNCRWPGEDTAAAIAPCWAAYYRARPARYAGDKKDFRSWRKAKPKETRGA